ncbi:glycine betaine ABC transporter substrate-binding protein [Clostridium paridis]|uniref:ABC transporter permease subunit n=1 Tax=Clostridium paridis TaxID=2803863 RepID=A0A937FEE8_9CLOT|nr:glycine betaine ABC transporter substrate-binding protein [Clostridium paridis]MBL4932495.1 ABC transporter permease subunit [Clostridium paridis]
MNIIGYINDFKDFIVSRHEQILSLILEHVQLTVISVLIAIIVGIPLGIGISRNRKLSTPIIGFANVVQAIPSLALLGFLIPILGIGSKPAILMVFLYSLLPIIKNTYTGLMNINPDVIEASEGMGMTKSQILRMVQLPLALPIIMTGIRISAVTAVGLMTIAAFIGAGGLGYMVFSGVQTVNNNMILAGAIPACALALLIDFIVGKIEKGVTPPGIRKADGTIKIPKRKNNKSKFKYRVLIAGLAFIIMVSGAIMYSKKQDTIVIGSKNFNEQLILGNMLATLIEKNTDIKVERKLNLGGTSIAFNALKAGELDMYVEYTGTGLVDIMKAQTSSDPEETYNKVSDYFDKNYNITWLKPLGFNNTYTLAVRQDTAKKYNLETFSDLAKVGNQLTLGCTIEFSNREDGYLGLKKTYNMNFKNVNAVDGGLRYTSLNSNKTDVIDAFSTDGLLKAFDLKVLKDDKNFFPPYYAAPMINNETLKKHPELKDLINKLAGKIDDEKMRELNYRVDKLQESPQVVAEDFLRESGLIK